MVDAGRTIILIKGEYDATETYEFLDVVYLASTGNSYICKAQSSTGNAPDAAGSQYWQIFCRGTIVDSVLDGTSQNPVANAAITDALIDKVDADGGDTADTVVSNFVSSQETLPVPSAGSSAATLWGVVAKFMSDARNLFIRATGDVAQTVVSTFTTQSTNYPAPAAGDSQSTLWGKAVKYLSDLKNNYCAKANLVDGFTQATAGVNALDAHAGKTLNDALANTNAALAKHTIYKTSEMQDISLPAATFVEVCSLTLPAGEWIIGAHVSFNNVASATRRIAYISPGGIAGSGIDIESAGNLTTSASSIQSNTSTTTYKLLCRSEIAVTLGRARMFAIGIKS